MLYYKVFLFVAVWTAVNGDCSFFEHQMSNGKLIYQEESDTNLTLAPHSYILRFECNDGCTLKEPQFIYCSENEWSDNFARCVMLDCPRPPLIEHAHFEIEKGTARNPVVGSKANYTCNAGYEMRNSGESTLSCVTEDNTAIWKGVEPHCIEKRTCANPGVSHHGYRKGSCCDNETECNCSISDVLTYFCKENYQLVGKTSIICLPGGNWSDLRPRCRPLRNICPDPPTIKNGFVKISAGVKLGDYYLAGEEVEIVCDPGYAFYGKKEYVYCRNNLEWDAEFEECNATFCPRPNMPANGSIAELEENNATEFSNGFELTYICDDGFKLYSNNIRKCNKTKWSGKEPQCKQIHCYDPGNPEYGTKSGSDFSIGSKVTFNCFSGYNIIGSVERYCLRNGQWSGRLARCNLKSNHCPNPGIPVNGKRIGDDFQEGDIVTFVCQNNFKLIGSNISRCLPDGTWSGEEARCLGQHDFDNENDVSDILKLTIAEKTEEQAIETETYEKLREEIKNKTFGDLRKIDLTYPGRLVLYFLFDVSGSVKEINFYKSIKLAQALVKKVGVSKNGARVGALTFSSKANIQFFAPHYSTTEKVLEELGKIKYEKGGTATSTALQVVREDMIPLAGEHLGYKNMKSIVFLLTDGKANTGGNPKIQGEFLRNEGVEIYCVGITGDIKKNELYELASLPLNEHVFILKDYLVMDWLVQNITNGTVDFSQCGLAEERNPRPRIIGGKEVIKPWPWMAALYFRIPGSNNFPPRLKCGGSIINQQWIMTAAHCLQTKGKVLPTTDVVIKLGLTNVENVTILQEFEPEKIIIHFEYEDDKTSDYDIALIKTNRVIVYNRYVRPVCLPPKELSPMSILYKPKENVFATGWGYDKPLERGGEEEGALRVDILKELILPLQEKDVCLKSLKGRGYHGAILTKRMFCAGTGDGKEDTCTGDSGGPLMQIQVNEEGSMYWTQVGIISWGIGCGQVNTYGIYTHVQNFLPWIDSEITKDEI